jgi:hypothetical protein
MKSNCKDNKKNAKHQIWHKKSGFVTGREMGA